MEAQVVYHFWGVTVRGHAAERVAVARPRGSVIIWEQKGPIKEFKQGPDSEESDRLQIALAATGIIQGHAFQGQRMIPASLQSGWGR